MNIENKIKEVADVASNFDLEDTRKAWENKSNDVIEYCVHVSDAIRIAKEYAEEMCKKQKKLCAESIHNLDWNVMNNDIDAHEALSAILATPSPTDKEGETTGEGSIWLHKDSRTDKEGE